MSPADAIGFSISQRLSEWKEKNWETRVEVLGHLQRGALPTHRTRNLASRLALAAVDELVSMLHEKRSEPPRLVGVDASGNIGFHLLRGDMLRDSKQDVRAVVDEVRRLAY